MKAKARKLDCCLQLATIQKELLPVCTRALIEVILFRDELVSLTDASSEDEVSLIMDTSLIHSFPSESLVLSSTWRAIEVDEGAEAIDAVGYISFLSESLCTDVVYLSTFRSDLILVPDDDVDSVFSHIVERLKERERLIAAAQKSQIAIDESDYVSSSDDGGAYSYSSSDSSSTLSRDRVPHFSDEDMLGCANRRSAAASSSAATTWSSSSRVSLTLAKLRANLSLARAARAHMKQLTFSLLSVLFRSDQVSKSRFFSFTAVGDELTMILDPHALALFADERAAGTLAVHARTWNALQVGHGSDGGSEGAAPTVSTVSAILASAKIQVYYFSTSNSDFILLPSDILNDGMQALVESSINFIVDDGDATN
jgi:hypothetical protein